MGGCATKLRQAFEAEDKGEKPEPLVEEDKKAAAEDTEEQFKERVKELVGEDENENENENEIAIVDEIQGCKQRPSLSLLFKQEEVKDWAESEKPKNEKQEPILEAQESEPIRTNEEDQQQQHADHDEHDHEKGKIIKEDQRNTSEQTKAEDVVPSSSAS